MSAHGLTTALVFVLALAGCDVPDGNRSADNVLRQAAMAEGQVIVTPPAGYCIDADSLSARNGNGFALIGSCASLSGDATGVFVEPAIVTLSLSEATGEDLRTDSTAFQTALGRGRVLRAINSDDLSLLQVEGGARVPPSADQTHWRALMQVNGQVVGLALYAAEDGAMTGDQGMAFLVELAAAIRRDSPAPE